MNSTNNISPAYFSEPLFPLDTQHTYVFAQHNYVPFQIEPKCMCYHTTHLHPWSLHSVRIHRALYFPPTKCAWAIIAIIIREHAILCSACGKNTYVCPRKCTFFIINFASLIWLTPKLLLQHTSSANNVYMKQLAVLFWDSAGAPSQF